MVAVLHACLRRNSNCLFRDFINLSLVGTLEEDPIPTLHRMRRTAQPGLPMDADSRVANECKTLVAIIGCILGASDDPTYTISTDERVVICEGHDYLLDWKLGARGGDDMWKQADLFLKGKRKGQIPKNCFFLDNYFPEGGRKLTWRSARYDF
ncbi:hypothetical protein DFH06DRAFT_1130941 [Mycena polygramma]|nr:hypothetical protein DFH06DRAFT_1130941 [Mycena polygramma]